MAKGFKHGAGGGGASLNFKVVGNPQPVSPKENTIWVNTDAEITSWAFSANEPENPTEGMVWFSTGTDSNIAFNALKKNGIHVNILFTKQYVDGAWVEKEFKIYQNGEWVNLITDILIYENGVQYRELENIGHSGTWFTETAIGMQANSGSAGIVRTSEKINLSGLSIVTVNFKGKVHSSTLAIVITDGTNTIASQSHTGTDVGTVSLDISSISGEYYVQLTLTTSGSYAGAEITRIHAAK